MVNSKSTPQRGRKEEKHDFVNYIEELKNRVDICQIADQYGLELNRHGQAECFNGHDEKTPSLKFYPDTQTYHCFGCNVTGDVISLVQRIQGCSFGEALNSLARLADMEPFQGNNGYDSELYGHVAQCLLTAAGIYHAGLTNNDPYLTSRGISYETAQRFMIGRACSRDHLRLALEQCGYDQETLVLSGLVKQDGTDFFQDHIVVPITRYGKVIDFYGRSLNGDDNLRHWRLPNDRLVLGEALFNWNPAASEIVLVEGVFDALALIQSGFDNAVATFGTQGLKDRFLRTISKSPVRKVYVCYDGDESGRKAALRDANAFQDAGTQAFIVELPDGTDPSEYISIHGAGEFWKLVSNAPSVFDYELSLIGGADDPNEKNDALNRLLLRCGGMSPLERESAILRIARAAKLSKGLVREQMRFLQVTEQESAEENCSLEEVVDSRSITPALDIVDGRLLITIQRLMRDPENGSPQWVPWVVTSDREWFPLENTELHRRGYHTMADQYGFGVLEQRYTPEVISDFVQGRGVGDLVATFNGIKETLRKYLNFPEANTFDFLTAWIIGTYCYVIFNYYPYVHLNGTKLVGKSKALKLLAVGPRIEWTERESVFQNRPDNGRVFSA